MIAQICPAKPGLVSVLMPMRNAERYVRGAVSSIIAQTYADIEIIIVDDGSSDASAEIVRSFVDARIKLFCRPPQGITKSLNFGLSQCAGEFVCRMDADDICFPDRVTRQVEFIRRRCADVVWCTADFIDENGDMICRRYQPSENFTVRMLHHTNHIMHPGVLMRRDIVLEAGGYDDSVVNGQDQALWLTLRAKGSGFALLREKLMLQRFHASNITSLRFGMHGSEAQRNAVLSLKSRDTDRFFHYLCQVGDRAWQVRLLARWLIGEDTIFWFRTMLRVLGIESLLRALRLVSPQVSYAPLKQKSGKKDWR